MQRFDRQWRKIVARARQAPAREEEAPFGFAQRVATLGCQLQAAPGAEVLWVRLGLRVLAGAVGVLIVCAVLELPHLRDAHPLEPGVENTVAQIVWSL